MNGQFLFASCHSLGFRVRALMRNTARGSDASSASSASIAIDLAVYRDGELLGRHPHFGEIEPDGIVEVSAATCPELATDGEHLVLARCSRGPDDGYLSQEHQLIYELPERKTFTTLLYDQLPLPRSGGSAPPIVLLAPKVWVSRELACSVVFASAAPDETADYQSRPLEISVLDEHGTIVASEERPVRRHDVVIFDVREAVADKVSLGSSPTFFDVVARGGAGSFAILTFLVNETTGGCAVEHSLSPHYYASRLDRLRDEALRFPALAIEKQPV